MYKVELKCTNGVCHTVFNRSTHDYHDVEAGIAYILTENPHLIYDMFGLENVERVTRLGIGYHL